jgi:hypothetical protein
MNDGEMIMITIFSVLCVLIGSIKHFYLKMKLSKFEQKSLLVIDSLRPCGCYQKKVYMGHGTQLDSEILWNYVTMVTSIIRVKTNVLTLHYIEVIIGIPKSEIIIIIE